MTVVIGPAPRLLFLVATARENPRSVDQLVSLLAPHKVVIHHDRTARSVPGFKPSPNLQLAPGPGRAGWGVWALVEAIRETMRHCLRHHEFDYLQVLSGSCLPIRPIADFQRFVATDPFDVHMDSLDLRSQDHAVSSYAYRLLADHGTFSFRALRALRRLQLGPEPERRPIGGLEVHIAEGIKLLALLDPILLAAMRWQGRMVANAPGIDPIVGSNWFGLKRDACAFLVERLSEPRIIRHFSGRHLVEEYAFSSILAGSPFRIGPSNHLVNEFDQDGHPVRFGLKDLQRLSASTRWFARKFPDDVNAQLRQAIGVLLRSTGTAHSRHGPAIRASTEVTARVNQPVKERQ